MQFKPPQNHFRAALRRAWHFPDAARNWVEEEPHEISENIQTWARPGPGREKDGSEGRQDAPPQAEAALFWSRLEQDGSRIACAGFLFPYIPAPRHTSPGQPHLGTTDREREPLVPLSFFHQEEEETGVKKEA